MDEIDVSTTDVRTALSEIPDEMLSEGTIHAAIKSQTLHVMGELPSGWKERVEPKLEGTPFGPVDAVEELIKARAARKAFNASPAEVRRQALDAAVSYDIQAFRGQLNDNVDDAYQLLSLDSGGTSAAFATKTEHPEPGERTGRSQGPFRRG